MIIQLKRCQPAASAKERSEPAGTQIEKRAGELDRRRRCSLFKKKKNPGSYSDQREDSADEKRCARYGMSCDDISLDVITISSWLSAEEKLQWIQSQRKDFQTQCLSNQTQEDKSIVAEEDSGEAIDHPDASNSNIQSRAYLNQLLLFIFSREIQCPVARNPGAKKRRSSKAQQLKNESVAKQLTTYEELSKMNVNC
ncbi:ATP-binding cassette transporter [Dorcoceras hygrometricum]|uniref:ATP-binding cassette transporter n=1 Tax=Dorcoceras hygrometricum TaxID=472368 RepID=A0A2Z7C872_9LAMI|nr:ATP-binding cassette transporter [Dorcoceras hygrometricum]